MKEENRQINEDRKVETETRPRSEATKLVKYYFSQSTASHVFYLPISGSP